MRIQIVTVIGFALLVVEPNTMAQAACGYLPPQARNLDDVKTANLFLKSSRSTYIMNDDCFDLRRDEFGGILLFKILNRFPTDIGVKTGYLFIKSYRTFSNSQEVKIKLSRGDGWFGENPTSNPVKALGRLDDQPFAKSVDDWNSAYASPGTPTDFATRLNVFWHAYATQDQMFSSTSDLQYWKIANNFDKTYGAMTDYLLRFDVNTARSDSLVPFQVYIQRQVKKVELEISSNIESLSTTLKLNLK
jgi:hypothetical protein